MVFPGRFSTGCLRCRQRRVKCDETKPSCRRCAIYGKECTGYTDQFHFRHSRHNSNEKNVSKKESSSSPSSTTATVEDQKRGSKSPDQQRCREVEDTEQVAHDQSWDYSVVRAPKVNYEDVSLCYFVRRFVSPNGADGFPGHLSFLPSIYNFHRHGILEEATLSVAQMAAYNQFRDEKFRMQSYKNYGHAIRMMQDLIQSEEATDDKVIASILLLCTLKDISGEGSGDPNEHALGLYHLVDMRGPGQIATERGAELLILSLLRLQIYTFLHEHDTYSDPGNIATVLGTFDLFFRAMSMMSKTLSLRHSLQRYYTSFESGQQHTDDRGRTFNYDTESQETISIIERCFEALDEFHRWDTGAASYWQSMFEGRRAPTPLGEVASGTYYDPETACTIILVRSARLILLMSMIVFHYKMQLLSTPDQGMAGDSEALAACIPVLEQDVTKVIDDIIACVPSALGDVDSRGLPASVPYDGASAIVILHSIRLVASCAYTTPEQFQKAMDFLTRFNTGIGIRSAVDLGKDDTKKLRWLQEQAFLRSVAFSGLGEVSSSPWQCAIGEVVNGLQELHAG